MDVYALKLHESVSKTGVQATRVPGGWLYALWNWDKDTWHEPVFVPFNNEFQSYPERGTRLNVQKGSMIDPALGTKHYKDLEPPN